jgi:hypothetical protein
MAPKIACAGATRHEWVKRREIDAGMRDGVTTAERECIKALKKRKGVRLFAVISGISSVLKSREKNCPYAFLVFSV